MLARHGFVGIDVGAAPHLLARDGDVHPPGIPVDAANDSRREEHVSTDEPGTRVDVEVADAPVGIVDINIVDVADVTIGRVDLHPRDRVHL